MRFNLPATLQKTASTLLAKGYQCFLVGGAIRDLLLKRPVKDYDLATNAQPEVVLQLFRRVIPTGLKHGTVTVLTTDHQYEITTFRTEGLYCDHRRPTTVSWTDDITLDLERRDFTINALAWDFARHRLFDPFGGQADLKAKIIRALGNPQERFQEDALRILRAIRFATELSFKIEEETFLALKQLSLLLKEISAERIRDELQKIVLASHPSVGFRLMSEADILKLILPELASCQGVKQPPLHSFDVFEHSLLALDGVAEDDLVLRWAALFHDIGKPLTQTINSKGELCFYGHENVGAEQSYQILYRLRFPLKICTEVSHLVRQHMFNYESNWSDAAVRRFVKRVGQDFIPRLFALRRADQFALQGKRGPSPNLTEFARRIKNILEEKPALGLSDLKVNGNDLMHELRLEEGPVIGLILNFLLESVLDDPSMNDKEKLLTLAQGFYNERLFKKT